MQVQELNGLTWMHERRRQEKRSCNVQAQVRKLSSKIALQTYSIILIYENDKERAPYKGKCGEECILKRNVG